MKKIRLIELFAGYGSQALGLKRAGIEFEHYKVVEFDKYAIKSYNAVHGTNFNTADIRDIHASDLEIVETDKYNYCLTYSFPCTDLSLAGKMQGMKRESGTRSGLLWEVERILKEAQNLRQVLLMENVPQVHSEQNIKDFGEWITFLDSLGYISKWQDLNAKDYGIPQNRERCFMISYLDKSLKFAFPEPQKLFLCARDMLQDNVSEKYYINTERANELIEKLIIETGNNNISVKTNTEKGFTEVENGGLIDTSYPESSTRRGRVQTRPRVCPTITTSGEISRIEKQTVVDLSEANPKTKTVCNAIMTAQRGIKKHQGESTGVLVEVAEERTDEGLRFFQAYNPKFIYKYRIRKLTPLECFRFMGCTDEEAEKMLSVNSETQCYKQAGNSIVVNVLTEIFKNIYCGGSDKIKSQIDIFDIL